MPRYLDFAPLISLAEISWDDLADTLGSYVLDPEFVIRPFIGDYVSLDPQIRDILYELTFPPDIYKLDVRRGIFMVHIGAAADIADFLGVDLSDTCIIVLLNELHKEAEKRGSKITNPSAIDNLRQRSELLVSIVEALETVEGYDDHLQIIKRVLIVEEQFTVRQYNRALLVERESFD